MPPAILFLDANVLYSACCRDLLLELAIAGLCQCRWSEQVLDETRQALQRARPQVSDRDCARLFQLMSRACPDALHHAHRASLPSDGAYAALDDLHVAQAAYAAQASAILTFNLKDFRSSSLAALGLRVLSPDTWLTELNAREPVRCLRAVENCRRRLRRPRLSRQAHLQAMHHAGLNQFAAQLARMPRGPAP